MIPSYSPKGWEDSFLHDSLLFSQRMEVYLRIILSSFVGRREASLRLIVPLFLA